MIRQDGAIASRTRHAPAALEPEPTGTYTTSRSGCSRSSSRYTVACPWMMSGSSQGLTKYQPAPAARSRAARTASVTVPSSMTTRASSASTARRLTSGAHDGMTMTAPSPCVRAA